MKSWQLEGINVERGPSLQLITQLWRFFQKTQEASKLPTNCKKHLLHQVRLKGAYNIKIEIQGNFLPEIQHSEWCEREIVEKYGKGSKKYQLEYAFSKLHNHT